MAARPNKPNRIVLVGLSGTGKSTVGKLVARRFGWRFVDTDDHVVQIDGRDIPRIFRDEGEAAFRALERQAVLRFSKGENWVVATGGGAVLDLVNRERLWGGSFIVHLDARAETLVARITGGDPRRAALRPLLAGPDPAARLDELRAERGPLYAMADWTVHTDGLTSKQVAEEIARAWELHAATLMALPGRMERLKLDRPNSDSSPAPPQVTVTSSVRDERGSNPSLSLRASPFPAREGGASDSSATAQLGTPSLAGKGPGVRSAVGPRRSQDRALAGSAMEPSAAAVPDTAALSGHAADPDLAAWVRTPGGEYPAYAGWGLLERLPALLRERKLGPVVHVVADQAVADLHAETLIGTLRAGEFRPVLHTLRLDEGTKTLAAAEDVYDRLVSHRAERRDALLAFGGGVATDLGGFVAATYLRGMPLVQVPTSLLGMVDAAVGGKVAVNHREGKNLIGAFYQPSLVLADAALLQTLPPRQFISGWGEIIKHALIMDPESLGWLETETDALLALAPEPSARVLRRNIALKARVVSADEREAGLRMTLNYGHTTGHALEAASGYTTLLHGEAVAVGMVAAAHIARSLGLIDAEVESRHNRLIAAFGLPLAAPGIDVDATLAAMTLDKKATGARLRWILLSGIGSTVIRDDVPDALVREAVERVTQGRT